MLYTAVQFSQAYIHVKTRGVESEPESPRIGVLEWSWNISFEGDSDSGPYLSHLDFCVILLQSI